MPRPKKITTNSIKKSLEEQLEKNGAKTEFYEALIADYIYAEEQCREMKANIEEKGLTISAVSAQGKKYDKDNPAIKALDMFTKQKLSILKQLGLDLENINTKDRKNDNSLL